MQLDRRQFNKGAAAAAGAPLLPRLPLPAMASAEDAYERILREFIRVEETAALRGQGAGVMTWQGRRLEHFLGWLDMRVNPVQTAGQVYGELRDFLNDDARRVARQPEEIAEDFARQIRSYADEVLAGPRASERPEKKYADTVAVAKAPDDPTIDKKPRAPGS